MKSLRGRIALITLVVIAVQATVGFVISDQVYRHTLDVVARDTAGMVSREYESLKSYRTGQMALALERVMEHPGTADAFTRHDREGLLKVTAPLYKELNRTLSISRLYFIDRGAEPKIFLRPYADKPLSPESYGDPFTSEVLDRVRQTRKTESGLEFGRNALSLRVVSPYLDEAGGLLGYVCTAETAADHFNSITRQTGNYYALFIGKQSLDEQEWSEFCSRRGTRNTWDDYANVVMIESNFPISSPIATAANHPMPTTTNSLGYVNSNGTDYVLAEFPLSETAGGMVGYVAVLHDVSDLSRAMQGAQMGLVGALILLTALAAVLSGAVMSREVTKRVSGIVANVERMSLAAAAGKWTDLTYSLTSPSNQDELGTFERYLAEFVRMVGEVLRRRSDEGNDAHSD